MTKGGGSSGVTKTQFTNLSAKVGDLAATMEGLTKTVEGIVATLAEVTQRVEAAAATATTEAAGSVISREEIQQLVGQAVAARCVRPAATVPAQGAAAGAMGSSRGLFPTMKRLEDGVDRVETLLNG